MSKRPRRMRSTWFLKAAEQGNADARFHLGRRYFAGDGVPQDIVSAHMWWNLAAALGHGAARERRDFAASRMTARHW